MTVTSASRLNPATAVGLGATGILIVGGSFPVTGLLMDYPVLSGQAIRYAIGGLVLLGVLLSKGRRLPMPGLHDLLGILGMVVAGMLGFNAAILAAEHYATPGFVAAVVGVSPLVLAVAVPLLGGRRPAISALIGAAIVVLGVAVLTGGGSWHGPGLVLALLCMAGEVLFTLCAVGAVNRLGALEVSTWSCLIAAVGGAGLATVIDGLGAWRVPTVVEGSALLVLGVFVTAVAFTCWYTCVSIVGADRAGVLIGLMPVSGLLVSVLIGAQPLTVAGMAGAVAVASGCVLGLRQRPPRAIRSTSSASSNCSVVSRPSST